MTWIFGINFQRWGIIYPRSCNLFRLAQDKIILTIRLLEDNPDTENVGLSYPKDYPKDYPRLS